MRKPVSVAKIQNNNVEFHLLKKKNQNTATIVFL